MRIRCSEKNCKRKTKRYKCWNKYKDNTFELDGDWIEVHFQANNTDRIEIYCEIPDKHVVWKKYDFLTLMEETMEKEEKKKRDEDRKKRLKNLKREEEDEKKICL